MMARLMAKSSLLLAPGVAPLDLAEAEPRPVEVVTVASLAPVASGALDRGCRRAGGQQSRTRRTS